MESANRGPFNTNLELLVQAAVSMTNAAVQSRWTHSVVDDSKIVEKTIEDILETNGLVGFDLETFGTKISIIQVAAWDNEKGRGTVHIFDVFRLKGLHQLQTLISSTEILKVMHDTRAGNGFLELQFGIRLVNVFDTLVANSVIQSQRDGQRCDSVVDVSLNDLCSEYGVLRNQLRETLAEEIASNPSYWRQRPLLPAMRDYAMLDTLVLIPLYFHMNPLISDQSAFDRLMARQLLRSDDKPEDDDGMREEEEINKRDKEDEKLQEREKELEEKEEEIEEDDDKSNAKVEVKKRMERKTSKHQLEVNYPDVKIKGTRDTNFNR